jgi:hypothetical protein
VADRRRRWCASAGGIHGDVLTLGWTDSDASSWVTRPGAVSSPLRVHEGRTGKRQTRTTLVPPGREAEGSPPSVHYSCKHMTPQGISAATRVRDCGMVHVIRVLHQEFLDAGVIPQSGPDRVHLHLASSRCGADPTSRRNATIHTDPSRSAPARGVRAIEGTAPPGGTWSRRTDRNLTRVLEEFGGMSAPGWGSPILETPCCHLYSDFPTSHML